MCTYMYESTDKFHIYVIFIYLLKWYTYNKMVISCLLFLFEKECRPTKESDTEVSVILGYNAASLSILLRMFLGNADFSSPRFQTSKNRFGLFERTLPRGFENRISRDTTSYTTKTETPSSPLRNQRKPEFHILL